MQLQLLLRPTLLFIRLFVGFGWSYFASMEDFPQGAGIWGGQAAHQQKKTEFFRPLHLSNMVPCPCIKKQGCRMAALFMLLVF